MGCTTQTLKSGVWQGAGHAPDRRSVAFVPFQSTSASPPALLMGTALPPRAVLGCSSWAFCPLLLTAFCLRFSQMPSHPQPKHKKCWFSSNVFSCLSSDCLARSSPLFLGLFLTPSNYFFSSSYPSLHSFFSLFIPFSSPLPSFCFLSSFLFTSLPSLPSHFSAENTVDLLCSV